MLGDPSLAIGRYLLTRLQGLTRANGYDLPEDFRLVTRELLDVSSFMGYPGNLPALVLMTLEATPVAKLSYIVEETASFQVTLFFEGDYELPIDDALRYKQAVRQRLSQDLHLGGLVDRLFLGDSPPPGVWEGTTLQAIVVPFNTLVEYDPRLPMVS